MKILMVSMASLHFFRWTEQIKDSGIEVYWFDIRDSGEQVERISWVHQKVGWKNRWNYPGRYMLKKKLPLVYKLVQLINERSVEEEFEKYLLEINPDVVHSFALQISATPIINVMNKHRMKKWIYSSWGSDLYYHQNFKKLNNNIKHVLKRVNYIITDCQRDFDIAVKKGFKGVNLGVFPGGGGYDLVSLKDLSVPIEDRKIILIKGYQDELGNCLTVLKALINIQELLSPYELIVFGAKPSLKKQINQLEISRWKNFKCFGMIDHTDLLNLMGNSLLYVGNSFSDGIPNTLIESVIMGVFPIQSNPGRATEELIEPKVNGLVINNPGNVHEIQNLIEYALSNKDFLIDAVKYNELNLISKYDRTLINCKIINIYNNLSKFKDIENA